MKRSLSVLMILSWLIALPGVGLAKSEQGITYNTARKTFEKSSDESDAHELMVGYNPMIHEMQIDFVSGDLPAVGVKAGQLRKGLSRVLKVIPDDNGAELDTLQAISAIMQEAESVEKLAKEGDWQRSYAHYSKMVGQCIVCHQITRTSGKMPSKKEPKEAKEAKAEEAVSEISPPSVPAAAEPKAAEQSQAEVSGVEWLQSSGMERTQHVMASMLLLSKKGVPLAGTPGDYYDLIQQALLRDTSLYSKSVTNILADIVYKKEPKAKAALNVVRSKVKVEKIEMH